MHTLRDVWLGGVRLGGGVVLFLCVWGIGGVWDVEFFECFGVLFFGSVGLRRSGGGGFLGLSVGLEGAEEC